VNSELVLDAPHFYAVALLHEEEAQSAGAALLLGIFAAGQHEDDITAAVGYETFGPADGPLAGLGVLHRLEPAGARLDIGQIAARVGLRERPWRR